MTPSPGDRGILKNCGGRLVGFSNGAATVADRGMLCGKGSFAIATSPAVAGDRGILKNCGGRLVGFKMGNQYHRYPATCLLSFVAGFPGNPRGFCLDPVAGGMVIAAEYWNGSGWEAHVKKFAVDGSNIWTYTTAAYGIAADVAVDPATGYSIVDTTDGYTRKELVLNGNTLQTTYSGTLDADVLDKMFIRTNLYLPKKGTSYTGVYLYVPSTGATPTAPTSWQFPVDNNMPVSGLYVDSTSSHIYAAFSAAGYACKFHLDPTGPTITQVWKYSPNIALSGMGVDETNGYVYLSEFSSSTAKVYVLDASTGALLWTWDCYHDSGSSTPLTDFGQSQTDVLVDSNNDVWILGLNNVVLHLKGYYDPATHEVVTV